MTAEIRTGAERSRQKGTAGTKKFKEGRKKLREVDRKRRAQLQLREPGMRVCPVYEPSAGQNKLFVILKWLWTGDWNVPQQSILNFMPAAPFKSLQEDIDSSKCHIFNWPLIIHFNSFGAEVCTLRWGPVNTEGWFLSCGFAAVRMCWSLWWGKDAPAEWNALFHQSEAHMEKLGWGWGPYVFHYRADILRKSRGVVLSDWFGKVVGVFYKLYFAAGFTRGKYLIPVEWFGKPDGGFPRWGLCRISQSGPWHCRGFLFCFVLFF